MMKSFFKKLAFVMALAMVVSLAAPAATASAAEEKKPLAIAYQNGSAVSEVNLAKVNDTEDLKFLYAPTNYKELPISWASTNTNVVDVDKNGVVTAVAAGSAIVSVAVGTEVAYAVVNVEDLPTYTATMGTAEERNITKLTLEEGETFDLAFFGIRDYDAKRYNCTWYSVDENVATVDEKGNVTAVAAGTTVISLGVYNVVTNMKHKVDSCVVTVAAPATPTPEATATPEATPTDVPHEHEWVEVTVEATCTTDGSVTKTCECGEEEVTVVPALGHGELEKKVTKEAAVGVEGAWEEVCTVCKEVVNKGTTPALPGFAVVGDINKTEKSVVVSLSSLNSKDYSGVMEKKLLWEVYAVMEGSYEYAWEVATAVADEKTNTVTLTGYDEFDHEQLYVVRIVDSNDTGNNKVLYEDTFVASVGPVYTIDIDYASYKNNQGTYTFTKKDYGCAFTNGNDAGEEIQTKLSYKLYDAQGVDVTGHYNDAANGYDIVTYEIMNEEVAPYVNIFVNEDGETVMTFTEILDQKLQLRAVYEDYDDFLQNTNRKVDEESIPVKQAPAYKVNPVDNWDIVRTYPGSEDRLLKNNRFKRQWMALFDDYDQASDTELLNHHIALWFTDNYGNYFTTLSENDGKYKTIENSAKFTTEGYELHFETRHPQVLVVGLSNDDTTDDTITSKKVGTAVINVTLHNTVRNDYDSTLINHVDKLSVVVKPERQLNKIDVPSQIKLATDSDPFNAPASKVSTTDTFGDYDTRWTTGTVQFTLIDNYNEVWGSVNDSRLLYTDITVTTDSEVDNDEWTINAGTSSWTWDKKYVAGTFDGAQLFDELIFNSGANRDESIKNNKTTYIKYTITVEDTLKEVVQKKTATFNVSLSQPTHDITDIDKDTDKLEIIHSANLKLEEKGNDKAVKNTDLETEISLVEYSKNGLPVNYMDGVTLITTKAQYDEIFNNKDHAGAIASKGDLYIVVYDTKSNILGESVNGTIGIYEKEPGLYGFRVANTYDGAQATEFAELGSYNVRVLQVTEATVGKKIVAKTAYTMKVEVKDGRGAVTMVDQKKIYVADESDIKAIAFKAISFNEEDYKNEDGYVTYSAAKLAGVKFRENTRANSVVIQNVYFKVYINGKHETPDAGPYYYISTVVNRTVKLNVSDVDGESIKKLDNAALDANN